MTVYSLPWLVVGAINLTIANFVPGLYASELGVPLFTVSIVLLGARLLDVCVDPLIGFLSDRTKSRFGRRKPWAAGGVPLVMLGSWLVFAPPSAPSATYLLVAISTLYLGFTIIQITYAAWGAELSDDYVGRNMVAGWREGFGVVGTLAAITSPLIAQKLGYSGLTEAMFGMAVAIVVLLPILFTPVLILAPDRNTSDIGDEGDGFFKSLEIVIRNRHFMWFMAAAFATFVGAAPGGAVGYLMMKHTFNAEPLYPYVAFGEFATMMLFLPFWTWFAGRAGKQRAIAIGIVWMITFTIPIPLLGYIDPWLVVLSATIRGIGFGAMFVVPYSIAADIIELDRLKTGHEHGGVYMAFGGMVLKLALMLGVFLATAWPTLFGFEPAGSYSAAAAFQVAVSYAWITSFFLLIAAPLFWFFPLNRTLYAQLHAQLSVNADAANEFKVPSYRSAAIAL